MILSAVADLTYFSAVGRAVDHPHLFKLFLSLSKHPFCNHLKTWCCFLGASLPVLKSLLVTMFPSREFSKWLQRRKGALFCTCVTRIPIVHDSTKLVPCSSSRLPSCPPWCLYTLHSSTYRALSIFAFRFQHKIPLPGSLF